MLHGVIVWLSLEKEHEFEKSAKKNIFSLRASTQEDSNAPILLKA